MMAWLIIAQAREWEAVGIDYVPAAIEAAAKRQGVDGSATSSATRLPPARGAAAALTDASGTSNRMPQIPGQLRR
jgi:hypothetical protein